MEKINTPLGELRELALYKRDSCLIGSTDWKIHNDYLERIESILPTERDLIEKAHLDGQKRSHSPSKEVSENYYSQTFNSYEKA